MLRYLLWIAPLRSARQGNSLPISRHIPELESLPLMKGGTNGETFTLFPPSKKITFRHLLLHTSGLSDSTVSLVRDYFASDCAKLKS